MSRYIEPTVLLYKLDWAPPISSTTRVQMVDREHLAAGLMTSAKMTNTVCKSQPVYTLENCQGCDGA